ncbi:hypothetical protein BY996DRAFT_6522054 [Phakopsora pachyrhizi]|nr:hypothetical protein BY996DRAFT_6522054 [Phakopsora pachyrhizi]
MPEEGSTRVATVAENYQKVGTARRILQGRQRKGLGSGGDVRIDNRRADEGKNALWRNKVCLTDKEAVGREEAGGRPEGRISIREYLNEKLSVGLVRRRETPHRSRTDIGGISKAVVGRAVGQDCRRARRRHTEVRSSYHFRVRAKLLQM